MATRVLFSPKLQKQRGHVSAHDPGSTYDGVASWAQRDHQSHLGNAG